MEDLPIAFINPTAYAREYRHPARGAPNPYRAFWNNTYLDCKEHKTIIIRIVTKLRISATVSGKNLESLN